MNKIVLNKKISESMLSIFKNDYDVIFTKEICKIKGPLRYHTDIQLADIGNDTYVCEPTVFEYYSKHITDKKLICGSTFLKSNYPQDIAYNIARVGDKYLCFEKYTDKRILENISGEIINIKQGYSKCNICIVDDNSVITSDEGIEKACENCGIDVLKIKSGQIDLHPFDYGFIGGASVKIKENIIFFGDITVHSDYEKIKSFCDKKNVKIKCFSNEKLIDLGGAIVL